MTLCLFVLAYYRKEQKALNTECGLNTCEQLQFYNMDLMVLAKDNKTIINTLHFKHRICR